MTSKSKTTPLEETVTNSINHEELAWLIIDKYFSNDPNILVKHHLESFNDFFNNKYNYIIIRARTICNDIVPLIILFII